MPFRTKKLNIILVLFLTPFLTHSQNTIGLPDIFQYHKEQYNAGTQNWDIKQDAYGIVHFANNEGLLNFDGNHWELNPLPNRTIIRSIEITSDHRIYAGGQDEIGYFERNSFGKLIFHSLLTLINAAQRNFGDVWDVIEWNRDIFFRTSGYIFKYDGTKISTYPATKEWLFSIHTGKELLVQDKKLGLLKWQSNQFVPLQITTAFSENDPITGLFNLTKDAYWITTLKNGVFQLKNGELRSISSPLLNNIKAQRIYAANKIDGSMMALATTLGGIYLLDSNASLIQHFSKKEGLQTNTILSFFQDRQKNIWLGLDNGIDYIPFNSPIKRIIPDNQNGSGYCAALYNNKLYIGNSSGLFQTGLQQQKDISFCRNPFMPVSNATGQNWHLNVIQGKLLLGHHEGAFQIEGNVAKAITNEFGFWNFQASSSLINNNQIIAGHYKGVRIFDVKGNVVSTIGDIPSFAETSRYLSIDPSGNIWVSHPYHGIFRLSQESNQHYSVKRFQAAQGLPQNLNNHIFSLKNKIVVGTEKGIYEYNAKKDQFEPSESFEKLLGKQSIRYVKEDNDGNIWFIHEKQLGVIDFSKKENQVVYLNELNKKMLSGFEFIYPINSQNILLGGENGFFHINFDKYRKNQPQLQVFLRNIRIQSDRDSLLFSHFFPVTQKNESSTTKQSISIDKSWGNIHVEFASPFFGNNANLSYRFRLIGLSDKWSDWSNKTEKDYTNLTPGNYAFEVVVKDNLGQISNPIVFPFYVIPPWYQTSWAYLFYFLISGFTSFHLVRWQRKKFNRQQQHHEAEQTRMQYLYQLEIEKAESELITLRNEKLQSEIDYKNSELATNAMHLVQKGELISKMKAELNHILKGVGAADQAATDIRKMIKMLSDDDRMDKDWDHFSQHFDKVNTDFISILKEKHPGVTANEIKLCTYLRMNLSTKEIAQLMNISVRGIEISRYRLRKKLEISTDVNLFDYLIGLQQTGNKS